MCSLVETGLAVYNYSAATPESDVSCSPGAMKCILFFSSSSGNGINVTSTPSQKTDFRPSHKELHPDCLQ